MNSFRKSYYVARHLGPSFVFARLRLSLEKKTGHTRRLFRSRPWEAIELNRVCAPGTPSERSAYVEFKRAQQVSFLFPLGRPPTIPDWGQSLVESRTPALEERVKLLESDLCVYFLARVSPSRIDWYTNPFDGRKGRRKAPWFDIPDFHPDQGDARTLWEPGRAAWAVDLARAAARLPEAQRPLGAAALGRLYWHWVESWMEACPPWDGFHWKCGQEASVRLIAIALGFWTFANDPSTTPERWCRFARLAWATAYRVFHHIDYAISQKNNHSLSEACGLMLAAHLFPEFRDAKNWWATGRRILERELARQVYPDGSYLQHSMNYHRVMLHVSLLAFRLAELAGQPFDRVHYQRLGKAADFFAEMLDPVSGEPPRYGANDGACVLPLNECGFWDMRPVVQAVSYLVQRQKRLAPGPWDEDAIWLFHKDCKRECREGAAAGILGAPGMRRFDSGGYYLLRREESWAMIRCHTYRDRPGQRDSLHVDLWWRGINVLRDCGTFQYYLPDRPDLPEYFSSTAAHNTLELYGPAAYERITPFLWFPWPKARALLLNQEDQSLCFVGEGYEYARRPWHVVHRRTLRSPGEGQWIVIDQLHHLQQDTWGNRFEDVGPTPRCLPPPALEGVRPQAAGHKGGLGGVIRWHLIDAPFEVRTGENRVHVRTAQGAVSLSVRMDDGGDANSSGADSDPPLRTLGIHVIRGCDQPDRVQGFASDVYSVMFPIPVLEARFEGPLPIQVITEINLG